MGQELGSSHLAYRMENGNSRLVTGEEASIQKEIQARLGGLMVGESEASMRAGAGSHTFQGSGAKGLGGIQKYLCAQKCSSAGL